MLLFIYMPELANKNIIIKIILAFVVYINLAYAKQKQVDPTMPKNVENKFINSSSKHIDQGGALTITAILTKDGNSSAVINDQIVHEKDQIFKYEVMKIESNKVILKKIIKNPDFEQDSQQQEEQIIEIKVPSVNIKD